MLDDYEVTESNDVEEGEDLAPTNESKSEKFLRLAPPRVNKVLSGIASLKKLSSSAYEYTPEQVEKMLGAIKESVTDLEAAFAPKEKKSTNGFSF